MTEGMAACISLCIRSRESPKKNGLIVRGVAEVKTTFTGEDIQLDVDFVLAREQSSLEHFLITVAVDKDSVLIDLDCTETGYEVQRFLLVILRENENPAEVKLVHGKLCLKVIEFGYAAIVLEDHPTVIDHVYAIARSIV